MTELEIDTYCNRIVDSQKFPNLEQRKESFFEFMKRFHELNERQKKYVALWIFSNHTLGVKEKQK